jgi:hypothetical protein
MKLYWETATFYLDGVQRTEKEIIEYYKKRGAIIYEEDFQENCNLLHNSVDVDAVGGVRR